MERLADWCFCPWLFFSPNEKEAAKKKIRTLVQSKIYLKIIRKIISLISWFSRKKNGRHTQKKKEIMTNNFLNRKKRICNKESVQRKFLFSLKIKWNCEKKGKVGEITKPLPKKKRTTKNLLSRKTEVKNKINLPKKKDKLMRKARSNVISFN